MSNILSNLTRVFNKKSSRELKFTTGAIDRALTMASTDVNLLNLEFVITTSTGEWLDEWGSWFGVARLEGETDEDYRNRILASCIRPKSTIPSIEDAIQSYLGDKDVNIEIFEPYTIIFKPSVTPVSEGYVFQDGVYYRPGVIDIRIDAPITPGLMDIVNQTKGAGIKVFFTKDNKLEIVEEPVLSDPRLWVNTRFELRITNPSQGLILSDDPLAQDTLISGARYLWMGDLNRISYLKSDILMPDTQPPVDIQVHSIYPLFVSGVTTLDSTAPLSGHRLSPYDIEHPTDYKDKEKFSPPDLFVSYGSIDVVGSKQTKKSDLQEAHMGDITAKELGLCRMTELGKAFMIPTITVSTEGWEGFSIIADIEEMTIEELDGVPDMSQLEIEIKLLS